MHKLFGGVVVAGLLLVGCGEDEETRGVSSLVRQTQGGACYSPLQTGKAVGEKCMGPSDCAEVCCGCSSGGKSYSVQVCDKGKCATADYACQRGSERAPASYCGQ
jgi:hypothetical protein